MVAARKVKQEIECAKARVKAVLRMKGKGEAVLRVKRRLASQVYAYMAHVMERPKAEDEWLHKGFRAWIEKDFSGFMDMLMDLADIETEDGDLADDELEDDEFDDDEFDDDDFEDDEFVDSE
jgi:hypothetical protein